MQFVYKLVDPRDTIPFYIGITGNPNMRFQQHLLDTEVNRQKIARIQEITLSGALPRMEIIEILDTREEANEREKIWIREYIVQGYPITNITYTEKARITRSKPLRMPPLSFFKQRKQKAVGWLQPFEIDEAWHMFIQGHTPSKELLEYFYGTFSSQRIPILRERDQRNLDKWKNKMEYTLEPSLPIYRGTGTF